MCPCFIIALGSTRTYQLCWCLYVIVLLCYCIIMLLNCYMYCYVIVLLYVLYYYVIALLYVLLCYCIIMLLYCYVYCITMLLCYCIAVLLCYCYAIVLLCVVRLMLYQQIGRGSARYLLSTHLKQYVACRCTNWVYVGIITENRLYSLVDCCSFGVI